jgi:hypothetical protein
MNPFAFAGFSASPRPKTQGSEIDGGFGARAAEVARVCDSEMAPQAFGIAQNGRRRFQSWAGEPIRRTPYDAVSDRVDKARFGTIAIRF